MGSGSITDRGVDGDACTPTQQADSKKSMASRVRIGLFIAVAARLLGKTTIPLPESSNFQRAAKPRDLSSAVTASLMRRLQRVPYPHPNPGSPIRDMDLRDAWFVENLRIKEPLLKS